MDDVVVDAHLGRPAAYRESIDLAGLAVLWLLSRGTNIANASPRAELV
jgi:hypothetical protein